MLLLKGLSRKKERILNIGFRTLEISKAAELHIKEGQLEVTSADGVAVIPIEDLNLVMLHGAIIRLSSMDLSILSMNKVAVITLDDKYLPIPQIVDMITMKEYAAYGTDSVWLRNHFDTIIKKTGLINRRDRSDIVELAESFGLRGYDKIMQRDLGEQGRTSQNVTGASGSIGKRNGLIDSSGRQLTAGQRVYFARSAIRDNEGRLLVVYLGTPTGGFTVFRNGLTYFTANKEYAERYTRASSSGRTGTTPMNDTSEMVGCSTHLWPYTTPESLQLYLLDKSSPFPIHPPPHRCPLHTPHLFRSLERFLQ